MSNSACGQTELIGAQNELNADNTSVHWSKLACAVAVGAVAALNLWVGVRLPWLTPASSGTIHAVLELDRRVASYPDKGAVTLLVLGNSHAMSGLQPPVVARGLKLPPQSVFSLALPGLNAFEARLLLARYKAFFPGVRRVLFAIDDYFLAEDATLRTRYLTRFSPRDRWRYAGFHAALDLKLEVLVGPVLPVADFNTALVAELKASPLRTLSGLVSDQIPPDSATAKIARLPFPWGYPPLWEVMTDPLELRRSFYDATYQRVRAGMFLGGAAHATRAAHFQALETLLGELDAAAVRVTLVELPYTHRFTRYLKLYQGGEPYSRFRAELATAMRVSGRRLIPRLEGLPESDFYDTDHLTPRGGAKVLAWIAAQDQL